MALSGIPIYDRDEIGNSLSAINNAFLQVDQKFGTFVPNTGGSITGTLTATNGMFTDSVSAAVLRGYGGFLTGMQGYPSAIGQFDYSLASPFISGNNAYFTNNVTASAFIGDGSRLYNLTGVSTGNLSVTGGNINGVIALGDTLTVTTSAYIANLLTEVVTPYYDPYYNSVAFLTRHTSLTGTNGATPVELVATSTFEVGGSTGTVGLSSKYQKFNKTSLYIDTPGYNVSGTIKYAKWSGNSYIYDFGSSTDFTIEFWTYIGGYPDTTQGGGSTSYRCASLIDTFPRGSGYDSSKSFGLGIRGDGSLIFFHGGGTFLPSVAVVPLKTWTHVALQRTGSTISVCVNGVRSEILIGSNLTLQSPEPALYIGGSPKISGYFNTPNQYGLIDSAFSEYRVTIGTARYSGSAYTVPASYFPYKQNKEISVNGDVTSNNVIAKAGSFTLSSLALEVLGNASLPGSILGTGQYSAKTNNLPWQRLTSSYDGNTQVAVIPTGIFVSTDYGNTWGVALSANLKYFTSAAITQSGATIFACATNTDYIYKSTNYGSNWVILSSQASSGYYVSVATNYSGSIVIAALDNGGYLKYSYDLGSTWNNFTSAGTRNWRDVAVSRDGLKIAAVANDYIYVSTDGGSTWTTKATDSPRPWQCVKMSADGRIQAAGTNGYLFISKDYGSSWKSKSGLTGNFVDISISEDGSKILASTSSAGLLVSIDYGDTWTNMYPSGSTAIYCATMAADGSNPIAGINNGPLSKFITAGGNLTVRGNIGIGTSVPNKQLTVVGEISATSNITTNGNIKGGNITLSGNLTGVSGTFTSSVSAPALSGTFYGDGANLTGVIHTQYTPPANATFTSSVSAPSLSGTFYGDGTNLTGVIHTQYTPPANATFTYSVSAPALSGIFYGDGSHLTGISTPGGLYAPLSGATFTGTVNATTLSGVYYGDGSHLTGISTPGGLYAPLSGATFTSSISAPALSGVHYGDGSNLTGVKFFVGASISTETATASANQTVFNLSTITYVPGQNNLTVYCNGTRLILDRDYTETSGSRITLAQGVVSGTFLLFEVGKLITNNLKSTIDTQTIIASSAQTVFTLSAISYAPGENNLAVYCNGTRLLLDRDYFETSSTSVTLASGVSNGTFLLFEAGRFVSQIGTVLSTNIRTTSSTVSASSAIPLDLSSSTYFVITLTASVSSFNITNVLPGVNQFTLEITQDGSGGKAVAWLFVGKTIKWVNGTSPTQTSTANRTDIYEFRSSNGGSTWYGSVVGQNFS